MRLYVCLTLAPADMPHYPMTDDIRHEALQDHNILCLILEG